MESFAYRLEALGELRAMDRLRGVEDDARARVSLVPASPPPPRWTPAGVFAAMSVCATP